jgi:proteasome beta subunit
MNRDLFPDQRGVFQPEAQHGSYFPGATAIGVVCKDGIVLAAEKRVSYPGSTMVLSKLGKKVFKITDHIGAACAGFIADMDSLIRTIEAHSRLYKLESRKPMSVRAAAKLMSNILFGRRFAPLLTETLVAGVDPSGDPDLFVLDPAGSVLDDKFACAGTGASIAIGVLESGYKEDLSVEEGKKLVLSAMKSAIARDAASGDGCYLLAITRDGSEETFIQVSQIERMSQ